MNSDKKLISEWLERTVIGLDLCPFARKPYQAGLVGIEVCADNDARERKIFFETQVKKLHDTPAGELSNVIIAFPGAAQEFLDFYEEFGALEEWLDQSAMRREFQLVVFHPGFYFAGENPKAPGNLVNRSPFPVIHLLRQEEVARAASEIRQGEGIAWANKRKIEALGHQERQHYWWFLTSI